MQEQVDTMLNLVHKLAELGEILKDNMVVAMLLVSLPDSYSTLVTALESRPENDLTLEFVKGKLIDEYERRKCSSEAQSLNEAAMKVSSRKNYAGSQIKCYFCQKTGHLKKDCMKYLKWNAKKEKESKGSGSDNKANICFMIQQAKGENYSGEWYVDSGASSHMVISREFFKDFKQLNTTLSLAKKEITAKVLGIGTGVIKCLNKDGTQINVTLKDVLYVLSFDNNLISVRKVTKNGYQVVFSGNDCEILSGGRSITVAVGCGTNLYRLATKETACLTTIEDKHIEDCQHEWHRKFGHRDIEAIKELVHKDLASGIRIKDCGIRLRCECCVKGKLARKPFPKASENKSTGTLNLIHTDVCGPMRTKTPGNNRYVLTIIDDYSRYSIIHLMQHKGEAAFLIKEFVEFTKTQFEKKPKIIRSDQGREYVNNDLRNYLKKEGIRIQYTVAYSPQQNDVAERKNRSLLEMATCMLILLIVAGLDKKYWGKAVNTANFYKIYFLQYAGRKHRTNYGIQRNQMSKIYKSSDAKFLHISLRNNEGSWMKKLRN